MRMTVPAPSTRNRKQYLLTSCAIAAGMTALAVGGPARAQGVQGGGQVILGNATISPPAPGAPANTTNVTTTTSQTVINWTPSDSATTGAPIDFLPVGNTLNFYGTGQYTVLNRFTGIDPLSGMPVPITRQVALNGTVNSYIGSPTSTSGNVQGGNIWFYNAGGILIGQRAVINVGSLVLTGNDIDTTGGLFGPGGEIRFRGASGSTASIDVSPQSVISAANPGNPGSSYIALVAPRINQGGNISVDGSAALVAAEQADIRINNGLFDINVLVGAEGGNVITHSGITSGPEQQGTLATDPQSRIYFVAIPKNDAVTMLVSGQVGYQDAVTAQTDSNGAILLSAGYNVTGGVIDTTPVNATAANITIADSIIRSDITAHASGAFVGGPLASLPTGGPVTAAPPPHIGRLIVQGSANFTGDASATFTVGANQIAGATGNFTLQSTGANGAPGSATLNVTGGTFAAVGNTTVAAGGRPDATTGDSQGGIASVNITGGTTLIGGTLAVNANATGGFDSAGNGGDGTGGTASLSVANTGATLSADAITVQANGRGGGLLTPLLGAPTQADIAGDGVGGTATVSVANGGSLTSNGNLTVNANGAGQVGVSQSGDGVGGTATMTISGAATSASAGSTLLNASGTGGGDVSLPLAGTFTTLAGGTGQGGTATLTLSADATSTVTLGDLTMAAAAAGGGASGINSQGGDADGGDVVITASNGTDVEFNALTIDASALAGGAIDPTGTTDSSGDAQGGTATITATGASTFAVDSSATIDLGAVSGSSSNLGSATGGDAALSASGNSTISVLDNLTIIASAGQFTSATLASAGASTGGNVDLTANGGTITAGSFSIDANAITPNTSGTGGAAQGGTIDFLSQNSGLITASNVSSVNQISANAGAGVSTGGTAATGGTIQLIADGGAINFASDLFLSAGGTTGGDIAATNPDVAIGQGGSILIEVRPSASDTSAASFAGIDIRSDGSAGAPAEGSATVEGAATGAGGSVTINLQAGTLTANDITASASGFGSANGLSNGGDGSGGIAAFTQTGGTATLNNLLVAADGFGGDGNPGMAAGDGVGGAASVNLSGGTTSAGSITASAGGFGGFGESGSDFDPSNPTLPGGGGAGNGGNATIEITAGATVTAQGLSALASGQGGAGGDFGSVFGGNADGGTGGSSTGGNARINLLGGDISVQDITADSTGIGGRGGGFFSSGSSGSPTGAGVGGTGGSGQGGQSDILIATNTADITGTVSSSAVGVGGDGGINNAGGDGGAATGGTANVQIDDIDATLVGVFADAGAFGGGAGMGDTGAAGDGGSGNAGNATVNLTGGTLNATNLGASAVGSGGSGQTAGSAQGGNATVNLFGGTLTATNVTAAAAGIGGFGTPGDDRDPANPIAAGVGGAGQGGNALVNLEGAAVTTTTIGAFSSGIGGAGGDYFSFNGVVGDTGRGGDGTGGNAVVQINAGDVTAGDIVADALGQGGDGGGFGSSTSGPAFTGTGQGGGGGTGQGGTASVAFRTAVTATGTVASYSNGIGGTGGDNSVGGIGGSGFGGTAEAVVENIDAGTLGILLDSSATGGDGGTGLDGAGGQGGFGQGGLSIVDVRGPNGRATVTDANFDATGTGGNGGDAFLRSGNDVRVGPTGGNGGDGIGGTVQVLVTDGAVDLGIGRTGNAGFASNGVGGDGGRGADNFGSVTLPGPDGIPGTMDDVVINNIGGNGGIAGAGIGGTVQLTTIGGSIASNGAPVFLSANGQSGNGGDGGDGTGGTGSCCSGFVDQGGTVILEARNSLTNTGSISFGDTTINTDGFSAGRIELIAEGTISMASLTASAAGFAGLTNNDTDLAPAGIFFGINDGGLIQTDGAVTLTTGSSLGVYAQGSGQLNVGGDLSVTVDDQVDIRHDFRTGTAPTIQTGGSASFSAVNTIRSAPGSLVSAGTSLFMNATGPNSAIDVDSLEAQTLTLLLATEGRINVYGSTTSGDDLTASARDEVAINNATAGDDISLSGGTVVSASLITNGTGLDSELDGSNIFIGTSGAANVDHAEADNDFTADVGSFTTGPNSIITGGDIDITSVGAVDLGNSDAGGSVSVSGQSILFDTITAGTTVGLTATGAAPSGEAILGNGITAGGDVTLNAADIRINDSVVTSATLSARSTSGNARLSATVDGDIFISSAGDIAGNFAAGGNIALTAATNITAQANAAGTYVGPTGPSEGFLFINAAGDANLLAGSGAATMIGVNAGTNANVDGATAGEDLYVLAGNTATVTNSTAGDDMIVSGTCCVIVDNVSTTGNGPDGRSLNFGPSSSGGPSLWQIQTGPTDLSNIVLTASAGTIDASNAVAFDNLTATASDRVTTTNTIRSGLATTITGSALDLESVTAGTDILLTSNSGGISAIGALSAGHDLTITSAAEGSFADLAAGDDVRITANGNVSAATLLTTAGGLDNEADNSGAYIDTPGNIAITGATSTVGQTRLTAGGTIDTGAITADYSFIDAVGAVNVTGDITSGGIYVEGSSVTMRSGFGGSGQVILRATDGDVTADGDVTTLADLQIEAPGAITVTGAANGGNFVQITGGSIDVTDVSSGGFAILTSTSGAINSTGTIQSGTDVIIEAATGGQLGALVAGDDVSLSAGGDVTVASITAEGTNPQGEEIGSNVVGTIAGTLTVTGSTFANDDVSFDATSIALQDVVAGGSLTATASGGPLSLTSADVANNITLTADGIISATGPIQSGGNTSASGSALDLGNVIADGRVDLLSTAGDVSLGNNISGATGLTVTSAGDIVQDAAGRLATPGGSMVLAAVGNVAVGDVAAGNVSASTGGMEITAGGSVTTGALSVGSSALIDAGGAIAVGGPVTAFSLEAEGSAIDFGENAVTVRGTSLDLSATNGDISGTGPISSQGSIFADATGAIDLTGAITSRQNTTLAGSSIAVGDVTSSQGSISLTANAGAVSATGTINAGRDIVIATTSGGSFDRLVAGDDIDISGSGDIDVAFMDATGENPDSGEAGSNITVSLEGLFDVEHAEAAGDFTADVAGIRTGLNSIITDGNIDITATGAADLGNSTAGGFIEVAAESIAFNTLDAGDYVALDATGTAPGAEGISGATILAGFDVILTGNSIDIGSVDAGGLLSAFGSGGDVAIDDANAAGNIGVIAAGNIGGSFTAGGDIEMSAGGDIMVSANAAGGAPDPSNGDIDTAGNLFIDAGGDVVLTDSSAAGMLGVNSGGAAALTNVTAGEDLLVRTGGFGSTTPVAGANGVSLTNVTAGDDLEVRSVGDIIAVNTRTTGQGPDSLTLDYTAGGFTISQGEGTSAVNGSDLLLTSSTGSIDATNLRAGDDITLSAATSLGVNGAQTLGLGNTAGGANIRASAGDNATLAGLAAFDDLIVNADGIAQFSGPASAGRDIDVTAASVDLADLIAPNNNPVDTLDAGRNLTVTTPGAITGGSASAGGNMALSAGDAIAIRRGATGSGGAMVLNGQLGVTAETLISGGTTTVTADQGAISVGTLGSAGPIALTGDSIFVNQVAGNAVFSTITTDVGDAYILGGGDITVTSGSVAGQALIRSDASLSVTQLSATNIDLSANTAMTLGTVTASNQLATQADGLLTVNGPVVGRSMLIASGDISIASGGRLGTQGTTQSLEVRNIDDDSVTYIGGTGTRDGYHIDQTEMTRLFAGDITILAPDIDNNNGGFVASAPGGLPISSVGSSAPPAVIIDDFTLTAGSPTSNLGASGSLTIATQGKARVIGDAALTGMSDANAFRISAGDSIEVILGEGTIRLTGGSSTSGASTPGGRLILDSEDVIVATAAAIADVGAATGIDAIDDRLAQNDGITLEEGALFAGGIDVSVAGGFYVQNSGTGTRFAQRRGLTFGALGLNVNTDGPDTRIVINGVHLGPSGQVTGLDAIPLLTINGSAVGGSLAFDRGSTMNGCLIVSSATCAFLEFESSFPVQDVINDNEDDGEGDEAEGMSLPVPLITMRDLDPLTGEPLLDDPVTGAGNDDLWTPPSE